jgi:phospholipid N-methyltransferase
MALWAVAETQLILFVDDHPDQSPADVPPQAKSTDDAAPPFAADRLPSIPLVNPDRQLTFGGAPHEEWPKPIWNRETITVDRIRDDIDGPSHRFVIQRGDQVEVYFSTERIEVGKVVGISHARVEASVRVRGAKCGVWTAVDRLYPVPKKIQSEHGPSRSRIGATTSTIGARSNAATTQSVARPCKAGLDQTDSVSESGSSVNAGFFHPVGVNEKNLHPQGGPMEQTNSETSQVNINAGNLTEQAAKPYTLEDFREFRRRLEAGQVTIDELKREFEILNDSRDAFVAHLLKNTNAKGLVNLAIRCGSYSAKQNTKPQNAEDVHQALASSFTLGESVQYSPFSGETYADAVRKIVESLTAEQLAEFIERRQTNEANRDKALTNPETVEEFRTFVGKHGEEALSDQQLAQMDALLAEKTREIRSRDRATSTVQKIEAVQVQDVGLTIKEGFHDKRQCKLWIVSLGDRVDRDAFNELNRKAKMLGGWYSSFKRSDAGFQFLVEESARKFASLITENVDRSEELERRQERRDLTAAERLLELATGLERGAEETLSADADKLKNTARRAEMAAGIRARAYGEQATARTLRSVAASLQSGDATFLDGIRHLTQLEALRSLLRRAKTDHLQKQDQDAGRCGTPRTYSEREETQHRRPDATDVRFAKYPTPYIYRHTLQVPVEQAAGKSGCKLSAAKMQKLLDANRSGDCGFPLTSSSQIEAVKDFIGRVVAHRVDVKWLRAAFEDYDRVKAANIDNVYELRAALRELLPHLARRSADSPITKAEDELRGKSLPGFFPTPPSVIERMLELAELDHGQSVLEPSCGKGDIADAVCEQFPNNPLTLIEINRTLESILIAKGYDADFTDFLAYQPAERFDRILMNPPFENSQDIEHIRHAYELLAPGGRLVSVASEGPFFRQDAKALAFRAWLDEVDAETEDLPANSFAGSNSFRTTSVATRLVAIDKP